MISRRPSLSEMFRPATIIGTHSPGLPIPRPVYPSGRAVGLPAHRGQRRGNHLEDPRREDRERHAGRVHRSAAAARPARALRQDPARGAVRRGERQQPARRRAEVARGGARGAAGRWRRALRPRRDHRRAARAARWRLSALRRAGLQPSAARARAHEPRAAGRDVVVKHRRPASSPAGVGIAPNATPPCVRCLLTALRGSLRRSPRRPPTARAGRRPGPARRGRSPIST